MEKLTKKDIISNIAEDSHLTKKDITEVVDLALTQIFEGLSEGKTVDLAGFGKFEITERKAREGFNPLTKEKIQIEASKSVKFKVAKALKEAVNPDMTVVNLMDYLGDSVKEEELAEGMQGDSHGHTHSHAQEDDDHDEAHDGSHDHGEEHHHEDEIEYDEHIWLSVKNAEKIVEELTNVLAGKDTKHAQAIRENASAYQSRLNELDTQYAQAVQSAKHDTVLFGDRFPFRYLVDDYGINYYAAFAGCSSETSASFKTVVFLSGKIDELGLSKVLVIENSGEQVAKTVIENTKNKNAEILTLDSMQSVTKKQIADGYTYLSVMEKNLEVLKAALN